MNFLSKISALAGIGTPYVGFDTNPTGVPTSAGTVFWDIDDNTLDIIMNGTTQKVGEDLFYAVKNQTGSTIPKGTAVRFAGTLGASGRLLIAPFLANGTYPSKYFMGVTSEDIANGDNGKVYQFGRCRGIDTSAYTEGTILYASTTVAGGYQTTVPQAPNNIVQIAAVISSGTNGTIFVRPSLGSNINEDEGVKITSVANNDILAYNSSQSLWVNNTIAGVLGYTPVSSGGTGTTNYVPKFTGANSIGNSSIYDDGNGVGIGNTSLTGYSLRVSDNISGATIGYGIAADGQVQTDVTSTARYFQGTSNVITGTSVGSVYLYRASQGTISGTITNTHVGFFADGSFTSGNSIYGFQGSIASGANRWNLYMDGTANNYIGGSLGIGTTTLTGYSLNIGKTITGGTNAYGIRQGGVVQSDVTGFAFGILNQAYTQATAFTLGQYRHFMADQPSAFGAGSSVTNQYGFFAEGTLTGATNNYGFFGNLSAATGRWNLYMSGSANNYLAGSLGIGSVALSNINLNIAKNITGSTTAYNSYLQGTIQSDVTSSAIISRTQPSTQAAAFTLGTLTHYYATQGTIGAGSTVTNQYGFFADSTLTGATNDYGFYGNLASGTNIWNLYMAGTANNFLAGSLGIGSTTLTGYVMNISKVITGATTAYGIYLQSAVQSDVTSVAYYNRTYASTQAAAFTLTSLNHYYASQGVIGAGSTVTNQYGFTVESNLVGAANNIGFYGLIPSGSGRWNIYMGGTASNYLAGNLLVGSTTDNGSKLQVTGAATISSTLTIGSSRPITLDGSLGTIRIKAGTGGWATGYNFDGSAGTQYGGFGAYGNSDALTYYYVGTDYLTNAIRTYPSTNYVQMPFNVAIGAAPSGITNFVVKGNITGGTQAFGISSEGTIQSAVTSQGYYYMSTASTQAAAFTLGSLFHYRASQGTFGAGSSVTLQYAFYVGSDLIGAGTNYAYFSNMASGSGRWNLYMQGSADNYLNGNLGIGTNSITSKISVATAAVNNSTQSVLNATTDNATYRASIQLVRESSSGQLGWAFTTNAVTSGEGTERMRISSAGNVSIGNTNNTYKLDVTGDINTSGVYRIAGTAYSVASATLNGFLTSTDWNTFNNKENAITAGTTAQYWRGDKTWQTLNTDAVVEATNLYFTNARAIGSVLTGYVSGAGTISATDTVLTAIQKLDGNIGSLVTGVSSVFGRTGAVTAQSGDYSTTLVTEGTNLYYTDARARGAISLTTTGTSGAATYDSTTGVLNIPQYQGPLANTVTGTGTANYLPKFTGSTTVGNSQVVDDGTSVLIGLTSRRSSFNQGVTSEFQIEGLASDTATASIVRDSNDIGAASLKFGKTRGTTVLSNTAVTNGDFIGNIEFQGGDGTTLVMGSSIRSIIDGTVSTGNMPAALTFYTNGVGNTVTERMRIASNGKVGIGSTALTDTNLRVSNNITGSINSKGILVDGAIQSDSTTSASAFASQISVQATAFTLPTLVHFNVNLGSPITTATVTNQFGFIVNAAMTGATNNYGFYGNLASATGVWNLYMNGTAPNYMAGSLGIGTTGVGSVNLYVSKNITGNINSYGIYNVGTIQSDVTTTAYMYRSLPSTAAATFTLGALHHFNATQSTIGAGSAVTNQYGYFVDSTLTGATNNYGFYGAIASGSNRYNIYMAGGANNYLGGSLGIGSTSVASINLRISKGVTGGTIAYSVLQDSQVQSDVTSQAHGFYNGLGTVAATFTLSNYYHFRAYQGGLGAGSTVTNQYAYFADATITSATNNFGFYGNIQAGANNYNLYMNGGANNYLAGSLGIGSTTLTGYNLRIGKNITGSTLSFGVSVDSTIQSDVTSASRTYYSIPSTAAAIFTLTSLNHFQADQGTIGAGSTITNQSAFVASSTLIGATNNYGFDGRIPVGTNRFNLYMSGTAANYLAGNLGIGSIANVANTNVYVAKTITGGVNSYAVLAEGSVQSDVTTAAYYFRTTAGTQAATFTLPALYHFHAQQTTFGAGSTVTAQYGYSVASNLTSATNNYGFYGNLASATGVWNIYMAGTANNYLAGNLSIGTTTLTSEKLNVNGNIRIDNGAADGGQLILASLGFNDWNIDNFSGVFRAYYNATEYFRISATGNVSIGNTNNTYKLDVNGDVAVGLASTANKLRIARPTDANATAAYLGFESTTSNTDFTLANNSGSGNLVFKANSSEAMRIDGSNSNALYIGTTSTLGGAGKLQIVQPTAQSAGINIKAADILQAFYNSSGTLVGIIQHNGTNTSYGTSSDYRLKTDFKLFNGLDLLDKIKVYDFAWKSNKSRMFGVIAHELQEVLPYAVSGIKDGDMIQSADYSLIVPILVQSIKDLKEEIETLKNNK